MRTAYTTVKLLNAMANNHRLDVEFTADAAFLTVGRTTWVAPLPPAGGAL